MSKTGWVRHTSCKRVGRPDDILVKPPRAPHLARDERPAQNPDEEPNDIQPRRVRHQGRQTDGDAAREQDETKHFARAELVAQRARHETHEEG